MCLSVCAATACGSLDTSVGMETTACDSVDTSAGTLAVACSADATTATAVDMSVDVLPDAMLVVA